MQGTHQECFKAINQDSEIRSAEGVELALLAYGAYHADEQKDNKEWEEVKKLFKNNYIRVPARTLRIPQEYAKTVESGGVLVERDTQGNGLNTKMEIPNIKIMVVEDEEVIKVHLKSYFEKREYTVIIASSAEEALPLVAKENPDLLLLDIGLPGMNGLELLKEIRKFNRSLKVILISGYYYLSPGDEKLLKELDAFEFVRKPIGILELEQRVKNALGIL